MLGEGVASFEGDSVLQRVRTAGGKLIDCDFAVVGIGVLPRVELALAAGLDVDNGVLRRRYARGIPHLTWFAAGDVARRLTRFYGERIRVEHWSNALNQGPAAARAMLGPAGQLRPDPVLLLRPVRHRHGVPGYAPQWDQVLFRGDRSDGKFVAFWLRDSGASSQE